MGDFSAFVVVFGGLLALIAVAAAWLFRSSSAPLLAKFVLPIVTVALACWAPFTVKRMMGFPVVASIRDLPDGAELVAFVPHDEVKLVDLWLIAGGDTPRAFEAVLDDRMKQTLRQAAEAMARGEHVALRKGETGKSERRKEPGAPASGQAMTNLEEDYNPGYVIDADAKTGLPAKQ